ncbi:MAG: hypothetical protein AAB037_02750, partial [Chloroflexota bacterium]
MAKRVGPYTVTFQDETTRRLKTLQQARDEAERLLGEFLTNLSGNRGKVLSLAAPPGLGKTHIAVQVVNKLTEAGHLAKGDVVWFAPRHDMFCAVPDQNEGKGWVHIRGRRPENCIHSGIADSLGYKHYGIKNLLCAKCEKHGDCDYFDQFKSPGHKFDMFQHLWSPYHINVSVVILDDFDPATYFLEYVGQGLSQDDLRAWAGAHPFGEVLRALADTMKSLGGDTLAGRALYDSLAKLTDLKAGLSGGRLPAVPKSLRKVAGVEQLEAAVTSVSPNFVKSLYSVMAYEVGQRSEGQDFNPRLTLTANGLHLRLRRELPDWVKSKPVILLNATPNEGLEGMLFGGMEFLPRFCPKVAFPSDLVRIKAYTDRLIGKGGLSNPDFCQRVVNDVAELLEEVRAEDHQYNERALKAIADTSDEEAKRFWRDKPPIKVGVICHKDIESEIDAQAKPDVIGYFWANRGSNEFKDCDALLVVGTPIPHLDSFVEDARALYWDRPRLDEREWKVAQMGGNYYFKPSSPLRWLMKAKREDELYQSVFRIRPLGVLDPKGRRYGRQLKVYIFSSLPIPGLGV